MSEKKIDYTDKYRHLETPVKGSLDPCLCWKCVCDNKKEKLIKILFEEEPPTDEELNEYKKRYDNDSYSYYNTDQNGSSKSVFSFKNVRNINSKDDN